MSRFMARLLYIDVRIVYLFFAVAAAVPFALPIHLTSPASKETMGLYDAIEECPPDKIVFIHSCWDMGTKGECWGQCQAVIEHMLIKGVKFVTCPVDLQTGTEYVQKVMDTDEVKAICKKYNRKYGEDWVQLGFIPSGTNFSTIQAMAKDFRAVFQTDSKGADLKTLKMMDNVKSISDVYLVYNIGYGNDVRWLSFVHGVYGTKIAFACAGIQSSEYYPYLQSGQIVGMLVGVRGGAEYEQLEGSHGMATNLIVPQAFCHTLMIFFVVLGNIGYFSARRLAAEKGA